jgi:hypothetical protein
MNRLDFDTTGRWLCMWPNGTRTIVFDAYTVEDVIEVLDEIGDAEPYMLHPLTVQPSFIDFEQQDTGCMEEEGELEWVATALAHDLLWEISEPRTARAEKPRQTKASLRKQIEALEDLSAVLLGD